MKRATSILMAAALLLALCAPVLATEEETPAYRLVEIVDHMPDGSNYICTLSYSGDNLYPDEARSGNEGEDPFIIRNFTYDEEGRLIKMVAETVAAGSTTENVYTYDEAGNLATDVRTAGSNGSGSVDTITYTYDENGLRTGYTSELVYTQEDGTENSETIVYEYVYDESGRKVAKKQAWTDTEGITSESEMTIEYGEDGSVTTSAGDVYTYDEQGRELTYSYDWEWSQGSYAYTYAHMLRCIGADTTYDGQMQSSFQVELVFDADRTVYLNGLLHVSDPTLTYDDNGYLVKAEDSAGEYLEFIYEQMP